MESLRITIEDLQTTIANKSITICNMQTRNARLVAIITGKKRPAQIPTNEKEESYAIYPSNDPGTILIREFVYDFWPYAQLLQSMLCLPALHQGTLWP